MIRRVIRRRRLSFSRVLIYAVLTLGAIVSAAPFVYMILGSL
ncbi:MAG: carbohydrate ABC transporter permease, partial [Chloroflexi bacterium]|nr:carbohydrate ABC transporter permease [Chloroflexota bacterium]